MKIGEKLIEAAIENGATLAGIASAEALRSSPSHLIYTKMGDYSGVGTVKDQESSQNNQLFNWPESVKSVLVIALSHPKGQPELDWWDGRGTPGNRRLIEIMKLTRQKIEDDFDMRTHKLHYYVEKGGLFLKDAAVLAGLGCIGKNNMLVTPSHGPRVRLRALFLEAEVEPTGPLVFDPCTDCEVYCRKVCPEDAMDAKAPVLESIDITSDLPAREGFYDRQRCNQRMEKDIAEAREQDFEAQKPIKYCRRCEFVCPVGKR